MAPEAVGAQQAGGLALSRRDVRLVKQAAAISDRRAGQLRAAGRNSMPMSAFGGMDDKPLPEPLKLTFQGETHSVATVRELYDLLTGAWPEDARGPRHRDAVETCLKVLDGHRSTVDAYASLKEAVAEAGMPAL